MRHCYLFSFFLLLCSFASKANPTYSSIEFVENKGQWEGPFMYRAYAPGSDVFLKKDGFAYIVGERSNSYKVHERRHGRLKGPQTLSYHAYYVTFEGAGEPEIVAGKEQANYYNYFLGNDPAKWKSGIHPSLAVDYNRLYNGIDMHIASEKGQLKYEFIVKPNADPSQIRMRYQGTDGLVLRNGDLIIKTSVGEAVELKPYVYQYINDERVEVSCKYKIDGSVVSFSFPKGYDASKDLVIDPTVAFSTFTNSTADNWGFTATYDNSGNFYAGGFAHSAGYPFTTGAFQSTFGGGTTATNSKYACDIAITKFGTAAQNLYSTYIGGSDNEQPHSLVVDAADNLIIAGRTYSANYPIMAGCYQTMPQGNCDIVVTKLNSGGTGLIGSTFIGGTGDDGVNFDADEFTMGGLKHNYGDDARSEVIIDNAGNIYVASSTMSTNFPLANATQATFGGGLQDAVAFKLNAGLTQLLWSTYLGGSGDDAGYVLTLDKAQTKVFVGGGTASANFPTTGSTFKPAFQGGAADGYIARYQNGGIYTRERITFLGQGSYDQCYGLQVDNDNNVYAMGQTIGGGFPIQVAPTAGSIYSNAGGSQFIIKLDPDLLTNIYSTVFGAGNSSHIDISPVAFLVDTCQNVYISGWGGTLGITTNGSSTTGLPTTPTAVTAPLTATTDGTDFYFFVLSKNAIALQFAGFYGRNSTDISKGEHVDGGTSRFDKTGRIYQAICGGCAGVTAPNTPFPVTTGVNIPPSGNCNLAALKIDFNLGAVSAEAKAEPNAVLCLGESITFSNSSANAVSYEWDFGDGSPTDVQKVPAPHTYTSIGNYTVRMIAFNPNACKVRDTVFLQISVDTNKIYPDFTVTLKDSCNPYTAQIVNSSKYSKTPGASGFTTFTWDFGDGKTATGPNPGIHAYNDTGIYTITMRMTDTTACNSPDTVQRKVHFSNLLVKAGFEVPTICEKNDVTFISASANAVTYMWHFGDGDTSSKANPTHFYDTSGNFTVKMYAYNIASCNKVDSAIKVIVVKPSPISDFTHAPLSPETNIPTTFTNKSLYATLYTWNFGDNTGSDETNPVHLYKKTGSYTVCLITANTEGCSDTLCKQIEAQVLPLVDVPTGFSPNGDGKNDILYPRGAGIEKLTLKIYNRWGQLIFEVKDAQANDPKYGWDGSYKGKQQEMESYAYILSGIFVDETTFYKKGNVTLLR